MSDEYPTKAIDELKPGDVVVVDGNGRYYSFDTVVKITATRVVCQNAAFMRASKTRVGDGNSWNRVRLATKDYSRRLMNVQEAENHNEQLRKENEHRDLAISLGRLHRDVLMLLSVDELKEILAKIESRQGVQP